MTQGTGGNTWSQVILAKQWGISLDKATKALKATNQASIWHAIHPLSQCYWTDYMTLRHALYW